ncbi:MAG TPA: glycogen debranching N-terminal domain-containing protein [Stellaceae bacterium]
MSLKLRVGPALLSINQGYSLLVTAPDGQISWPSTCGFFVRDTRVLSAWSIYADGEPWQLLNSGAITYFAAQAFLTNPGLVTEDGAIEERTLLLKLGRSIGEGGVHEDLDITNHGGRAVKFNLEIAIRCDFADILEVKSGRFVRRGRIISEWSDDQSTLTTRYRDRDFVRELAVARRRNSSPCVYANGRISFEVAIDPGRTWHACLEYSVVAGAERCPAPQACIADAVASPLAEPLENWRKTVLKAHSGNEDFDNLYRQAVEDMAGLRLPVDNNTHHLEFTLAAGIPWFVALFGRDSLIAALQNAQVYPDFVRGALDVLGRYQATERDDERDAEPGKIMHELRSGELAHFKLIPHTPYYGTADATPLYLIALHTAWRCTGDRRLVERHLGTAERCLDWIDRYGDRDGDGFQEYQTRSSAGYENQSWKDAGDAVLYPDGGRVKGPKAMCELQGYVYDAWSRMAEIYDALGRGERARELRDKAGTLFARFNEVFWDEESGFYAYCLDGDKKPVLTVASNPGHCLWSRIVPKDRARRVAHRLLRPDMWSGWGIRTLSGDHPAYNPLSYQNGSVWPHDNGIIAIGLRQYGLVAEATQVARAVIEAGSFFALYQMPELYAGIERDQVNFPVQYPDANVPQAWAAGSVFSMLQALLGFDPDAPRGKLYVDPSLPDWLPELTLKDLRLGKRVFDVRFRREADETRFEVLKGDADAVARRSLAESLRRE